MIVDAKGLEKAMKEAFKGNGYEVAFDDSGGKIEVILAELEKFNWTEV